MAIKNVIYQVDNGVDFDEIHFKTKAAQVVIEDTGNNFTATTVEGAMSELFQNVSNGKSSIATAITGKGVTASGSDAFPTLATKIGQISTSYFPPWFPNTNNLIGAKNMDQARNNLASSIVGTNIYVMGGNRNGNPYNTNECYDTLTNTWVTKASMPTTKFTCMSESVGDIVYVYGYNADVYAYNTTTNTWTTKTSTTYNSGEQTSCLFNDDIYIFGGSSSSAPIKCYNTTTNTWTTKALMLTQRSASTCGLSNGKVYVMGGYTTPGGVVTATNVNECYDIATNTWTTKKTLIDAVYSSVSECVEDNVYLFGGVGTNSTILTKIYCYNIPTDSWSIKRDIGRNKYSGASCVTGKNIYISGGMSSNISSGAIEYGTVHECYII